MDRKLLEWGLRRKPNPLPRLWLFTDEDRLPDPRPSVARLPRGRAGVVLRHDRCPQRAALGRDLARICRARRLILVVAGDARLAAQLHAGVHLRNGRWPGPLRRPGVVTSSAHSIPDLRRARASGVCLVFLSPAFTTASHPGASGLGALRWAAMARAMNARPTAAFVTIATVSAVTAQKITPLCRTMHMAVLGGVDGRTVIRLPPGLFQAVGAIGALAATKPPTGAAT
jgi:thiamine-phosphate pyrophosphorylase